MSIDPMTMEELLANEAAQRSLRPLRVGQTVEGTIAAVAGDERPARRRTRNRSEWTQLEETRKSGSVIDALVLEANRGGMVVDVGVRTFVSVAATKARGTTELSQGDVLSGTVVGVTSYGLFDDVGVADGLVHCTEITWEKGVEPTSLHPLGTVVNVVVTGVDRERERISLSIKRTGADPWERYVNELETGQTVAAAVTRVMPYGAFARLAEGVEGLIRGDRPGAAEAVFVCSSRRAHMKRCPEGGRVRIRTYNRNQMMPTPIYGPEEL